ncbi:pre-peptidase C-terminal domain-containing protein [Oculatella sp. LEGE 06141]|uniref:ELWxxDGT repeat protein n=1 Tax=Oculatella sp. LEGE 06141 TaxID=1828648 RepID=UPI0018824864|nr:ELWxxDGT repeat protein [Oculatella sp. LEGE 06141]MBE9181078.1 pre-peptidase C-terminal domain-containing protein [Oculatella sp. LEGE 06141]
MVVDRAGNTLKKAKKLGNFDAGNASLKDFVEVGDKNDLYTFNVSGRSSFDLSLSGLKGANADVELFQLAGKKAAVLKSIGAIDFSKLKRADIKKNIRTLAKSSRGGTSSEAINLNLNPGEYYVRVYQRTGNSKYTLNLSGNLDNAGESLASARNITVNETSSSYSDYVGKADPSDVYSFSLTDTRNVNLALNNLSADANLFLLNSAGNVLASSSNSGATPEAIAQQLNAGKYFVQVSSNGGNTRYNLNATATLVPGVIPPVDNPPVDNPPVDNPPVDNPPAPLGDSLATAVAVTLPLASPLRGSVSDSSIHDYYKFSVAADSDLSLLMSELTANANIQLLDASGTVLQTSALPGTLNESIHYPLAGNTPYYLRVFQAGAGSNTNYAINLALPADLYADSEAEATNFTSISNDVNNPSTFSDYAGGILKSSGGFSEEDYFKIQITERSQFTLVLDGLSGNLDVELYQPGASLENRLFSTRAGTSKEEVRGNLNPGTYFVRIYPGASGAGSTYTLQMSADPTANAPAITRDIYFGPDSSNVKNVTNVSGTVYFEATDELGSALWKSNGTLDGTVKIKALSSLGNFISVGGTLYFTANDGINGVELWKSDGTETGTIRVTDLAPGSGDANPEQLTAVGNNLYFWAAINPNQKDEKVLHRGTVDPNTGEMTVETLTNAGVFTGDSNQFTNVNGTLYYRAATPTQGNELYRITNAGTATPSTPEIIDVRSGNTGSNPSNLTAVGDSLFFVAGTFAEGIELRRITNGSNDIAVFDATEGSTRSIRNNTTAGWRIAAVGSTVYFAADGGDSGEELWKIVNAETADSNSQTLVKEIQTTPGIGSDPLNLTSYNNKLYFTANDGINGRELWVSDGTSAGTKMVKNINMGDNLGSDPGELTVFNGLLYFSATDGESSTNGGTTGRELWASDGTLDGTSLVLDINSGGIFDEGIYTPEGSNPRNLTVASGQLYFVANNGDSLNGVELWSIP